MKLPDQLSADFILATNQAKNISLSLVGNWARHLTGESNNLMINTGLNVRALSNLRFTLQPLHQRTKDELQYIQQIQKQDGSTSYLLGTIDNRNLGLTFRMDLAITPEMTIQYYGSPFVSIGKFLDFKRVSDPQSSEYYNRFTTMVPGNTG